MKQNKNKKNSEIEVKEDNEIPYPEFLDPKKQTIIGFNDGCFRFILKKIEEEIGSLKDKNHPWRMFNLGAIPLSSRINKKIFVEYAAKELEKIEELDHFKGKEIFVCILFRLGKKYKRTDLDNLAKNLIDIIKNKVIGDDSKIKGLYLTKVEIPKSLGEKWRTLLECSFVGIAVY